MSLYPGSNLLGRRWILMILSITSACESSMWQARAHNNKDNPSYVHHKWKSCKILFTYVNILYIQRILWNFTGMPHGNVSQANQFYGEEWLLGFTIPFQITKFVQLVYGQVYWSIHFVIFFYHFLILESMNSILFCFSLYTYNFIWFGT